MAVDHFETEYHLTPDGWVQGTEKFFGKGKEKAAPANRLETWLREETQSSRFSAPDVSWHLIWPESMELSTNKTVRDRFPKPGRDFPA